MSRPEPKVIAVDVAGRTPPHDIDLEATVLDVAITEPDRCLADLRSILGDGAAFYAQAHRLIWAAIVAIADAGQPVDIRTVVAELRARGELDRIGGVTYVSGLVGRSPHSAHARVHAERLEDLSLARSVIDTAQVFVGKAMTSPGSGRDLAAEFATAATALSAGTTRLESSSLADEVDAYLAHLAKVHSGAREAGGMIAPSLPSWSAALDGFGLGHLHVVGADTGGGKTSAAWQALLDCSGTVYRDETVGGLVVSGEMTRPEMVERAMCIYSGLIRRDLLDGALQRSLGEDPIDVAANVLRARPVRLVSHRATLEDIRALCVDTQRRFDADRKPGTRRVVLRFVLVDYLGIMKLPNLGGYAKRHEQIAAFTTGLKELASTMSETKEAKGIHLLAPSQFNREGKLDREPTISHLEGSGAIENDSDRITLIDIPQRRLESDRRDPDLKDYARFRLEKGRMVEGGQVLEMRADLARFRFVEPDPDTIDRWREAQTKVKAATTPRGWK